MNELFSELGHVDPRSVSAPWAIVLGGVTRKGNRRAHRAAARALDLGLNVVWFDGYEETDPLSGARVPLEGQGAGGVKTVVVGFKAKASSTLAERLQVSGRARNVPVIGKLMSRLGRRIGTILRARACWSVIRDDIKRLGVLGEPTFIVFTDDHMLTSAWYAGRVWKSAAICSSLPVK